MAAIAMRGAPGCRLTIALPIHPEHRRRSLTHGGRVLTVFPRPAWRRTENDRGDSRDSTSLRDVTPVEVKVDECARSGSAARESTHSHSTRSTYRHPAQTT